MEEAQTTISRSCRRGDSGQVATTSQLMRWRWISRALNMTLFEPYVIESLLPGTWLWNMWLRGMGADISMGALVFADVRDHDFVKVRKIESHPWGGEEYRMEG